MIFRIANTFANSLARLTGSEQKQVKTAAFDLQLNPAQPGLQMHKLDGARDRNFWSVRVNHDIRIIVHRTEASTMLVYVDHHDKAYAWAARRRIDEHLGNGTIQLIQLPEQVEGRRQNKLPGRVWRGSGWILLLLGLPLALLSSLESRSAMMVMEAGASSCPANSPNYLAAILATLIFGFGTIVHGLRWRRPFNAVIATLCFAIFMAVVINTAHTMQIEREQISACR